MADDRPLETTEEAVGRIDGKIADLESTLLARLARRPTGDIEMAFRGTPKPGTLFLQGQTLNRIDYPDLWAWAQASGSVVAGGYTAGNGTTTFTLPDMRDRFLVGASAAIPLGGTGGAATRALVIANLPSHNHNVTGSGSTGSAGSHSHGGVVDNSGVHSGHNSGAVTGIDNPGGGLSIASSTQNNNGGHTHSFGTDIAAGHTHTVSVSITEALVGSGTAFDTRPPWLGVNVAVWT